jgi:hypothetical protein
MDPLFELKRGTKGEKDSKKVMKKQRNMKESED